MVHLNGRALAFQNLIQSSSAVVSSSREQNTPRSRQRRCNSANHRSTWLIHDEYVGVRVSCTREGQPLVDDGGLCAVSVVVDHVDGQAARRLPVHLVEEATEPWPGAGWQRSSSRVAVFSAANRSMVLVLVEFAAPLRDTGDGIGTPERSAAGRICGFIT